MKIKIFSCYNKDKNRKNFSEGFTIPCAVFGVKPSLSTLYKSMLLPVQSICISTIAIILSTCFDYFSLFIIFDTIYFSFSLFLI